MSFGVAVSLASEWNQHLSFPPWERHSLHFLDPYYTPSNIEFGLRNSFERHPASNWFKHTFVRLVKFWLIGCNDWAVSPIYKHLFRFLVCKITELIQLAFKDNLLLMVSPVVWTTKNCTMITRSNFCVYAVAFSNLANRYVIDSRWFWWADWNSSKACHAGDMCSSAYIYISNLLNKIYKNI